RPPLPSAAWSWRARRRKPCAAGWAGTRWPSPGRPPHAERRTWRGQPCSKATRCDRAAGKGGTGMCGVVGYAGRREAAPVLLRLLARLEYRGHDSAGLAAVSRGGLHVRKRAGRVADLAELLRERPAPGCVGISHTRWATHGPANDTNAHPH